MSVSIRPLDKTRWLVRVYRAADRVSAYKTTKSQKEALRLQGIYAGQELEGVDVVAALKRTRATSTHPSVKDAIPAWIGELVATRVIRRSSEVNYRSRFNKWVAPAIGSKTVDKVTREDLGRLIETVKAAGSLSAIKHCLNPLRSYYRRHRALANPTVDLADYLGGLRTAQTPKAVFTREEEQKILAQLGPVDGLFTAVSFGCGVRWNECAALAPSDIDVERRLLTVRQGVDRFGTLTDPKTPGSRREVPVRPALLGALRAHLETLPTDAMLLFPSRVGTPRSYTRFHERWTKALKAAGVRHRGFHSCRHTFASRARSKGVRVEILQAWLGHATVEQTLGTYVHTDVADWQHAVRLLEAEVTS
jgi:integrase